MALFCLIYILFHLKDFFKKEVIIKCIINVIFILLITAFFLIPIAEFAGQADYIIFEPTRMRTSGEWAARNAIEPWQFIKDKVEENGVSFVVGIPTLVMIAISVLAYRYIDKKHKDFYLMNFILGIVSLYMCTKFFPWRLMPQILTNVQYPWRLEELGIFFFIPVMAMNVYYLLQCIKKPKIRDFIYLLIILVIGVFTVLELKVYSSNHLGFDERYEEGIKSNPVISHFNVNRDYLPLKAGIQQSGYTLTREDRVYIVQGNAIIEDEEKYALDFKFIVRQANKNTVLELPYLFYPGYTVELDTTGKREKLEVTESDMGFLQITLPEDIKEGNIIVTYTGTLIEKWGYAISGIGLILFIEYIVYSKKNASIANMKTKKKQIDEEKDERETKKL